MLWNDIWQRCTKMHFKIGAPLKHLLKYVNLVWRERRWGKNGINIWRNVLTGMNLYKKSNWLDDPVQTQTGAFFRHSKSIDSMTAWLVELELDSALNFVTRTSVEASHVYNGTHGWISTHIWESCKILMKAYILWAEFGPRYLSTLLPHVTYPRNAFAVLSSIERFVWMRSRIICQLKTWYITIQVVTHDTLWLDSCSLY